ncbi:MAG: hypothetical protein LAN62_02525 [Acidobacteriia bacterium]|nr:hypothetical protein [Terriglobia bacterium]
MGVTPEELAQTYPLLYHMADAQSWESIRKHGLLSTSALLDLFEVNGKERAEIESRRRPERVVIEHSAYGHAVIRDQKPLIESKLAKSLRGCTLREWYYLLNKHVFFWLTKERLHTLLCAREYRDEAHAVLTLDTLTLVKRYEDQITLSPMNSGNTQPIAHPRGPETFQKMQDYPFKERAGRGDYYQVVELAIEGGVEVVDSIVSVDLMQCAGTDIKILSSLFRRA